MRITLDKTSNMFGLTFENMKLRAMQSFLRDQGITVTYPNSEQVVLDSPTGAFFNTTFQQRVEEIVKQADNRPEPGLVEPNQYSWSVLDCFLLVVGLPALAMVFAALAGASGGLVAGVGLTCVGAALLVFGLFPSVTQSEPPIVNQPLSFGL